MKAKIERNKGFTILEVVLVLAIAGMIFLMVFIALPQMRRSQRDAERRDDMMLFVEAVKKYQTNNRGILPQSQRGVKTEVTQDILNFKGDDEEEEFTWIGFYHDYLDAGTDDNEGTFRDPEGDFYNLSVAECTEDAEQKCSGNDPQEGVIDYTIYVYTGGICKDDYAIPSTNPRDFAALYHTDSSGVICYDSRN